MSILSIRIVPLAALAAAAVVAGCGGGDGSKSSSSSSSSSSGSSASSSSSSSSASGAQHEIKAGWFAVGSRFRGASAYSAAVVQPKKKALGFSHEGTITAYGPGKGPGGVVIRFTGPDETATASSLAGVAQQVIQHAGDKILKGPTKTTLGGYPALAYFGKDNNGNELGLVVTQVTSGNAERGVYYGELTAKASLFRSAVPAFDSMLKSFRFLTA